MTTILVLSIAAAALWVIVSLAGRTDRVPKDSVEDFSRALSALSTRPPAARPTAARRTSPRRPAQRRRVGQPSRRPRPAPRPVARR